VNIENSYVLSSAIPPSAVYTTEVTISDSVGSVYLKNGEMITGKRLLPAGLNPMVPATNGRLTVYLNSDTGNDNNDGLSSATAKQTLVAMLNWVKTLPMLTLAEVWIQAADNGSYTLPVGYEWRFPFRTVLVGSPSYGDATKASTLTLTGSGAHGITVLSQSEFSSWKVVRELTGAANMFTVKPNAGTVGFWRVECANTGAIRVGAGWFLDNGAKAILGKCGATNFAHFSWLDRGDMNVVLNNESGAGQIFTDVDDLFGMSAASVKVNGDFTNHTFTDELAAGSTGIYVKNGELISSKRLLGEGYNSRPRPASATNHLTVHVNGTTGSDNNDGITPATAVATVEKAVDLIKSLVVSESARRVIRILDSGNYTLPSGFDVGVTGFLSIIGITTSMDASNPDNYATIHISSVPGAANAITFPSDGFVYLNALKIKVSSSVANSRAIFMGSGKIDRVLIDTEDSSLPTVANTVCLQCDNGIVNITNLSIRNFHYAFRATASVVNIRDTGKSDITRMDCPTLFQVSGATINSVAFLSAYSSYTNVSLFDQIGIVNYGESVTLSDNKWENVPFTLKNGYTSAGLAQFNVKYNKALKAYSISFSGLNKVDMTFGEVIATVNAPLPMTPPRQMYGGSIILDTYSAENTPVGRLALGLGIKANGDIQIWPTDTTKTTGTVPNTKPGRLYGRVIFTLEEWTT
jgi:hypothetical protein